MSPYWATGPVVGPATAIFHGIGGVRHPAQNQNDRADGGAENITAEGIQATPLLVMMASMGSTESATDGRLYLTV